MAAVKKKVGAAGKRADSDKVEATINVAGKSGGKSELQAARKGNAGKKASGRKRKPGQVRKSSGRARRSAEQVMAAFEEARLSDVSDKVFVASSPVHGKGLFAATRMKAGTVISRLHGMPTFDDGIYVLWITDELGLELTNDLKYINHDKNPNTAYSDLDVSLLRDVEAGEELLHDYGW